MPFLGDCAVRHMGAVVAEFEEAEEDYTGMPSALVPDRCRMVIDRRFILEESLDEIREEVHSAIERVEAKREGFRYDFKELFSVQPTVTDKSSPIVTAVASAIANELGQAPEYVLSPGTYDQKHIDRIGRLSYCIAYGLGILDLAHQPDEYIGIQDMLDATRVMARTLVSLLTEE